MVATASHNSGVLTQRNCKQKMGSSIRRKPYTPIFDIVPVSNIVVPVGASAYAAGSHVWNGTSGTFTAKPRNAPKQRTSAVFSAVKWCQSEIPANEERS